MSSIPCIQGIIFAFGGTLAQIPLDTTQMHKKAAAIAAAFDIALPQAPTVWAAVDRARDLLARTDRQTALEFHTRCRFALLETEMAAAAQTRLLVPVSSLLQDLADQGLTVGVVTLASLPFVESVVPQDAFRVAQWLTREAVTPPKPDPAPYLQFLDAHHLDPARTLAVGTRSLDFQGPHQLGCRIAQAGSPAAAGADFIVPAITDLPALVGPKGSCRDS